MGRPATPSEPWGWLRQPPRAGWGWRPMAKPKKIKFGFGHRGHGGVHPQLVLGVAAHHPLGPQGVARHPLWPNPKKIKFGFGHKAPPPMPCWGGRRHPMARPPPGDDVDHPQPGLGGGFGHPHGSYGVAGCPFNYFIKFLIIFIFFLKIK